MIIDAYSELKPYLHDGERLLWAAQPKQGIMFRTFDFFLIPFSILWCSFSIFWITMAISSGAPIFFVLFGVPFVLIGLMFVFGRFIMDLKSRKNTFYGITDNRILIRLGIYSKTIKSLNIETLTNLEYEAKADGSGTIFLMAQNQKNKAAQSMGWWPGAAIPQNISHIKEVDKVYAVILAIKKKTDASMANNLPSNN